MNAISIIKPYRYETLWVFDDPAKELVQEPLVSGTDELLNMIVGDNDKCVIMFSANEFPDAELKVEWVEEVGDNGREKGNWYFSSDYNKKFWLCPALFKYFDEAPKQIYVKIIV